MKSQIILAALIAFSASVFAQEGSAPSVPAAPAAPVAAKKETPKQKRNVKKHQKSAKKEETKQQ